MSTLDAIAWTTTVIYACAAFAFTACAIVDWLAAKAKRRIRRKEFEDLNLLLKQIVEAPRGEIEK